MITSPIPTPQAGVQPQREFTTGFVLQPDPT
jgi:hypothetical protein